MDSSENLQPSARSRNSIDPDAIPVEAIRFVDGAKIEAVDNEKWYKAKIVKVLASQLHAVIQ